VDYVTEIIKETIKGNKLNKFAKLFIYSTIKYHGFKIINSV